MLASSCGYDTEIYGLYFPSWVVAPVLGAIATVLSLAWITRTRLDPYVPRGPVVFAALTVIFAVVLWRLFFTA